MTQDSFDPEAFRAEFTALSEEERLRFLKENPDNFIGKVLSLRAHDDPSFLDGGDQAGAMTTEELAVELGLGSLEKDN